MKKHQSFYTSWKMISTFLLFILMIFCELSLSGQTPVNFSGVWLQDNSKSNESYKRYDVVCTIMQTPLLFTIKTSLTDKNSREISNMEESYNLDGKEISKEEYGGVDKLSAKWSADKKILITKTTRNIGNELYGSEIAYSLSNNDIVLTIQTTNLGQKEMKIIQVLNKKK
jgi:hypothetical protein